MPIVTCKRLEPEGETLPVPMDYYDFYDEKEETSTTTKSESESNSILPTIIEEDTKAKSKSKSRPKSSSKTKSRSKSRSKSKSCNEIELDNTETSSKSKSKTKSKKKSKAKHTRPDPPESLPLSETLTANSVNFPTPQEPHHILSEVEESILDAMNPAEREAFLEEQRQVLEEIEKDKASHEMALATDRELNLDDSRKLPEDDPALMNENSSNLSSRKAGEQRDEAQNDSQHKIKYIAARSKFESSEDDRNVANRSIPTIQCDEKTADEDQEADQKSLYTNSTRAATFPENEVVIQQ